MSNGFTMIYKCLSWFSFQTLFCVILSTNIDTLQPFRDSRAPFHSISSSDGGNNFPIRRNPLSARAEKQVEQFRNMEEKEEEDSKQQSTLDVNQTLSTTTILQPENTVCYNDLGCITRFSFADPLLWPINLLPEPRKKINTHFTLYTRENRNPQPPIQISAGYPNEISATTFKASRPTKFVVHGWQDTGYEDFYQLLLQRLLIKGDFNVISVHWGEGASAFYFQAHANNRLVGLEIALLVNTMVGKLGVKAADVHLIGHSLGAHSAGYAGEKIPNLGRITGLDPAGPYFGKMPSYVRLDYTDAQFVDAVHTNAGLTGINEPAGHIDFYPNGGTQQPGCEPSDCLPLNGSDGFRANVSVNCYIIMTEAAATCNHRRAVLLYSASLQDTCQFVGYECSDYDCFNNGKCTSCGSDNTKCAPFGLEAINYSSRSPANAKFYFTTSENTPYCMSQYSVLIKLSKPPCAKATAKGLVQLSVVGEDGHHTSSLLMTVFEHGKNHSFILNAPSSLGPISKVYLHWKYIQTNLLDPTCILGICNKKLYVNNVTVSLLNSYPEANNIANTYVTCPRYTPAAISSFKRMEFNVQNRCSSTFHLLNFICKAEPWIFH